MKKHISIPVEMAERLMDMAGRAQGLTDTPTLMMFAEVRKLIQDAKRK